MAAGVGAYRRPLHSFHLSALQYVFDSLCGDICLHAYLNYVYLCILLFNQKHFLLTNVNKLCVCVSQLLYINCPLPHSSKNITPRAIAFAIKMKLEHTGKNGKAPQWDFYHPKISWQLHPSLMRQAAYTLIHPGHPVGCG